MSREPVSTRAPFSTAMDATETDATPVSASFTDYNEDAYGSYEEAVEASYSEADAQGDGIEDSGSEVDAASDMINCGSSATAANYIRSNMVARTATIKFRATYIKPNCDVEDYSYYEKAQVDEEIERIEAIIKNDYFNNIKPQVFKFTGNFKEGDYLMWNWNGTNVNYEIKNDGVEFIYSVKYLSSKGQENMIDSEVNRLLNNEFAGWENMHDYEKVRMVYKWMTSTFKYVEGDNNHSTYSGIINHRTVCQGFATSMYRLLGEMGLNVRLIANSDHGWNIVQLGRYWYSLDATWDVGKSENRWEYFLPAEIDFELNDHFRGVDYDTEEFHQEYPMSWWEPYDYALERDYVGVDYRTHVQSYGWQNFVYDGAMSGTSGESKRLEAIELKLDNLGEYDLGIEYRTHIQGYGWESQWKKDGQLSGTSGESRRLEAIQIRLTGSDAAEFDVYYRVHVQNIGWLDWAKNGQKAGTQGVGLRLEAIQIMLLNKGTPAPGLTTIPFYNCSNGNFDALPGSYKIKVNKQMNCITIYKGNVPVKAMVCSTGYITPVGTFDLKQKWRWKELIHDVYGQYSCHITGDFLFHSVPYDDPNIYTLLTSDYNKLGQTASAGCIRLTTIDAKWMYDNCPTGTIVEIYNSEDPGPLGKPTAQKIPPGQTWDPTDPLIN